MKKENESTNNVPEVMKAQFGTLIHRAFFNIWGGGGGRGVGTEGGGGGGGG